MKKQIYILDNRAASSFNDVVPDEYYLLVDDTDDDATDIGALQAEQIVQNDAKQGLKYGTRIENAAVTGTYNLDHALGTDWLLTLIGDTIFTEDNLPTGTGTTEFILYLTGEFNFTTPVPIGKWKVIGDEYNGAIWNLLTVHVMNGNTGSENITCIISNIE